MKKELWNIFVYVLIGVLLCLNVFQCSRGQQGDLPPGSYADTLTIFDTVRVEIPTPKYEKPIGSVTAKLPVSVPKQTENERKLQETVQMLRDSLANYGKTVPDHFEELSEKVTPDSVSVEIPITQKVYETDRYRAIVSGYKPSLDDIYIYQPTQIVQVKSKPKRWGVGIQFGYGVTLKQTPQFSPYVGVGVSYNLFQF